MRERERERRRGTRFYQNARGAPFGFQGRKSRRELSKQTLPLFCRFPISCQELQLDGFISDSSLCGADETWWTRGAVVREAAAVPVMAYWGASFLPPVWRESGKLYRQALTWLWKDHRELRRVGVICGGNDILGGQSAQSVRDAWLSFANFWQQWQVELVLVDVVPPASQY